MRNFFAQESDAMYNLLKKIISFCMYGNMASQQSFGQPRLNEVKAMYLIGRLFLLMTSFTKRLKIIIDAYILIAAVLGLSLELKIISVFSNRWLLQINTRSCHHM